MGALAACVLTLVYQGALPEPSALAGPSMASAGTRGWSLMTLLIALPLFAWTVGAARRGSLRGRLGWLGTLTYLLYTYLELAVAPPEGPLYLVYIATFGCALCALCHGVSSIEPGELEAANRANLPRRLVGVFGLFVAAGVALLWLTPILSRAFAGHFSWPTGDSAIVHVVQALDLGLLVPLNLAGGILLLRRRPAGVLMGGLVSINATCLSWALAGMAASSAHASGQSLVAAAPSAVLALIASTLCATFFHALEPTEEQPAAYHLPQRSH